MNEEIELMNEILALYKEFNLENERADKAQQDHFERQMNFLDGWRQKSGLKPLIGIDRDSPSTELEGEASSSPSSTSPENGGEQSDPQP